MDFGRSGLREELSFVKHHPTAYAASSTASASRIQNFSCLLLLQRLRPRSEVFRQSPTDPRVSNLSNDPVYAKYVASIVSFPEDIKNIHSLWDKLFLEYYSGDDVQSMVYLLIDGMDEAFEQERATFLELLQSLQQTSVDRKKLRIQILMVGRPELSYDIEQALDENLPTINVSTIKIAPNIENYVTTKVAKERNLRRISKGLRDEIVTELTKRADGMFLWVDLMLKVTPLLG